MKIKIQKLTLIKMILIVATSIVQTIINLIKILHFNKKL